METFTLTVEKKSTETKEITLPFYRKSDCHAYKIFSPEKCICVCHGLEDGEYITTAHAGLAYNSEITFDCSKEEFEELFYATNAKLIKLAVNRNSEAA